MKRMKKYFSSFLLVSYKKFMIEVREERKDFNIHVLWNGG